MTTKIIIAAGNCEGKQVVVDVVEFDTSGHPFVKENRILKANEFAEYYIWKDRQIIVNEVNV